MVFKETKTLVQYLLKIFSKAFSCKMQPAWSNKSLCYRDTKKITQKEQLLWAFS